MIKAEINGDIIHLDVDVENENFYLAETASLYASLLLNVSKHLGLSVQDAAKILGALLPVAMEGQEDITKEVKDGK